MGQPLEAVARKFNQTQPLRLSEGISNKELAKVLEDAANEAHRIIARNALKGGQELRVRQAMKGIGEIANDLWKGTYEVTKDGIHQAAQLAAEQSIEMDALMGMPKRTRLLYQAGVNVRAEAGARAIIARRENGFKLSDRIYANGRITVKQVGKVVEQHLALQLGPRELANAVRGYFAPDVPGGASYAAKRLARTEINNAHHDMTIDLQKDKPWVTGFTWNLSGSHPRPDECNDYDKQTFKNDHVPSKPHPQCLCYLTVETVDDETFKKRLNRGDYAGYLDRMAEL